MTPATISPTTAGMFDPVGQLGRDLRREQHDEDVEENPVDVHRGYSVTCRWSCGAPERGVEPVAEAADRGDLEPERLGCACADARRAPAPCSGRSSPSQIRSRSSCVGQRRGRTTRRAPRRAAGRSARGTRAGRRRKARRYSSSVGTAGCCSRPGRERGQAGAHVDVVGREPDPVGEAAVELRRRDARLDQQQVRLLEPGEPLGIGALLRPPHHDDVVVRCRSRAHRPCVSPHVSLHERPSDAVSA